MKGKFFRKPDLENSEGVPPGQYLTNNFPVLSYGTTPEIDLETWELKVWGFMDIIVGENLGEKNGIVIKITFPRNLLEYSYGL